MKNLKVQPQQMKKKQNPIPNSPLVYHNLSSHNSKGQIKYPQYNNINQNNLIQLNQAKLQYKPYSGIPNSKPKPIMKPINYPRSPTEKPTREIASAHPILITKLFSNGPLQNNQDLDRLSLSRSLPKSDKPPLRLNLNNLQVNHSIDYNNLNIRHSVALPVNNFNSKNNMNIINKQSPIDYTKVSNHSNRNPKTNVNINRNIKSSPKANADHYLNPTPSPNELSSNKKQCIKECFYQEEKNLEHRKTMEDFHQIKDNFCNDQSKAYFAIFDGHSGKEAAVFCKETLHHILAKSLSTTGFNVEKSFNYTFNKVDEELKIKLKANDIGTTATVVFIHQEMSIKNKTNHKILYCANVGDSKCYLLSKGGKTTKLTTDHKCNDPVEVERIRKSGGLVFSNRVFGTLALTRTLGDLEMKKYGVLCTPSITKYSLNEDNLFVILASDGVWDVVTEEDLLEFTKKDIDAETLCKQLVNMSMERDSRDNISCIVIKL